MNEEVLELSLSKVDEYESMMAEYDAGKTVLIPMFAPPILSFKDEGWVDWLGNECEEIHIDCKCSECTEYTDYPFVNETISEESWMKYGEEAYIQDSMDF